MSEKKSKILAFGLDPSLVEVLSKEYPSCSIESCNYDLKYFETAVDPMPVAILCGHSNEMQSMEIAQSFRMVYQDTALFFISTDRNTFNRKVLQKNGFTDAFLMPTDQFLLLEVLGRVFSSLGELKRFRTVRLADIPSDNKLGFDLYIYLSANNRHIKFASSDDCLDEKRLQRLRKFDVMTAAVSEDQMKRFYEFAAAQLKKLNSSSLLSETEKKEKRESAVRDVFSSIFSEGGTGDTIDQGRAVMNDCQEILKSYIMSECETPTKWIDKVLTASSSTGDTYNHASNVSTYAAFFSIGLGIGRPEEVALAGLLHDIGIADLPIEVSRKLEEERSPEETKEFEKHPTLSVEMIKQKKIIVSEIVLKMILQHHERVDGKGYPQGITGSRFLREAQILAIADQFDYLTKARPGHPRVSPLAAMLEISRLNAVKAGECRFDPELLRQIVSIFQTKAQAA